MLSLDVCLLCECECDCDCDCDCGCGCDCECDGVGSGVGLVSFLVATFWAAVSRTDAWTSTVQVLTTGAKLKENLRFMAGN